MKRIILVAFLVLTLLGSSVALANDIDPIDPDDGDSDNSTANVSLKVNIVKPAVTGGGGGGSGQFLSDTDYCGVTGKFWINWRGTVINTFTAGCEGGPLTITVNKGTIALDENGKPLKLLSIYEDQNPPDPPTGANIITIPYTLEPSGAKFSPPLTFTWTYDELPEGADEDNLVIAFWNGFKWVYFDCEVNTKDKTITASVSHFTTFAALAFIPEEVEAPPVTPLTPAAFLLTNLVITPPEVELGGVVTISAQVMNTGQTAGSYDVILELDGELDFLQLTEAVELSGGVSQLVTFTATPESEGIYTIAMNGLTGSFTVTVPEVFVPEEEEEEEEPTPFPWWVIIVVALIFIVGLYWLWSRKR